MKSRIVIVEDEYRTRQGLAKLIENINEEFVIVGQAEDGLEGLRLIQQLTPDVVFTDIRMPRLNGLEMLRKIREMHIECKIVILSGYSEFDYAQQAIRIGVADYLLKPITISMVRSVLEKLQSEKSVNEQQDRVKDGDKYSAIVQKAIDEINCNYAKPIRLETFADDNNITPQYLSALFSKETGNTFSNYLRDVRMEKAKDLLKNGNKKVYEVACEVGYPDQKYFSRVFKECVGISAKQYAMNLEAD